MVCNSAREKKKFLRMLLAKEEERERLEYSRSFERDIEDSGNSTGVNDVIRPYYDDEESRERKLSDGVISDLSGSGGEREEMKRESEWIPVKSEKETEKGDKSRIIGHSDDIHLRGDYTANWTQSVFPSFFAKCVIL